MAKKKATVKEATAARPTATVEPAEIELPYTGKVKVTLAGVPAGLHTGVSFPVRVGSSPFDPIYQVQSTPFVGADPVTFEFPFAGVGIALPGGTYSVLASYVDAGGRLGQIHGGNITIW